MRDWQDHQDLDPLIKDMIEWIGSDPRPYGEVMDAWRTSCPRLTIWEDAIERGLVRRERTRDNVDVVVVTDLGNRMLATPSAA